MILKDAAEKLLEGGSSPLVDVAASLLIKCEKLLVELLEATSNERTATGLKDYTAANYRRLDVELRAQSFLDGDDT